MTYPKLAIVQNEKREWHFALLTSNSKSVMIGGETFKRKPPLERIRGFAILLRACIDTNKVEYVPYKKK